MAKHAIPEINDKGVVTLLTTIRATQVSAPNIGTKVGNRLSGLFILMADIFAAV